MLIIHPSTTNLAACDDQLPYTWNGLSINSSGIHTGPTLTNHLGCDSDSYSFLTINHINKFFKPHDLR